MAPLLVRRRGASPGGKGILQQKPRYQAAAAAVSEVSAAAGPAVADKRDDLPHDRGFSYTSFTDTYTETSAVVGEHAIPDVFVDTILEGFGAEADLFRDIMKVGPDAEPRQLRICYFRRGREVLMEGGVSGLGALASGDNVPELTKTRFQAVSMAYEILSNPTWKAIYMEHGLKQQGSENEPQNCSDPSQPPPSKSSKVKWNESVEELIFDHEPDEKLGPLERKKSRGKRPKTKILIEGDAELDAHLAKLDQEAEPHFVTDFFDSLEESLDGLLKLAGSSLDEPSSTARPRKDNNETSSLTPNRERGPIERAMSNDEDSLVGMFATHILGISPASSSSPSAKPRNSSTTSLNQVSPESTTLIPLSHSEAKLSVPFRCISPDPSRDIDASDVEKGAVSPSPTLSVSSRKEENEKNNSENSSEQHREEEDDDYEFKVYGDDDEDVFDGIEDEKPSSICLLRRNRAASPANFSVTSMVSELSESVANQSPQAPETFDQFLLKADESKSQTTTDDKLNSPSLDDLFNELPDEEFFDDVWCDPSQPAKSLPCGMCDRDEEEKATKEEQTDGMIQTKRKLPSTHQQDGYLEAFNMAMNCDFTSIGRNLSEIDWKTAVLGAFMVEDDVLLQLMEIVATEINNTPALEVEDAMESPTQHVIETAISFS